MPRTVFKVLLTGMTVLQAVICLGSDNAYYAARREAVMERIEGSVAVLEGAFDTSAYTAFRQDNNFYYLTGVESPNALLLLDASRHRSILFLPHFDKDLSKWEGPFLFAGDKARRETGMDEVMGLLRKG